MTTRRLLLAVPLAVVAAGCAARPTEPGPTATPSRSPVEGATLRQLGFRNGPGNVVLPPDLRLERVIDQPNVVTLFLTPERGAELGRWLSERVVAMGFVVDADANGSLLFHDEHWRGAFTQPLAGERASLAALTLREQR